MAKVTLDIGLKTTGTVVGAWLTIDDQDVVLRNGKGTVQVAGASEHRIFYWMSGNPGAKLTATVEQDGTVIRTVEETIPQGYYDIGDSYRFKTL